MSTSINLSVNKKGFTLVELLIVISIIAILSVIGMVAYGNFLKNSRDARRQSDLKFIQSALEEYHADQIFYPSSMDFSAFFSLTNSTGNPANPSPVKTYLKNVPIGPTATSEYLYQASKWNGTAYVGCINADNATASTSKCVNYCLFAKIERTPPPSSDPGCTLTSPYNYGVTRP